MHLRATPREKPRNRETFEITKKRRGGMERSRFVASFFRDFVIAVRGLRDSNSFG
jgi:hypothetical protein